MLMLLAVLLAARSARSRSRLVAFFLCGRSGKQLAANFVCILANFAWTSCCSIFVFGGLRFINYIRVTERVETIGIDVSEHGAHKDEDDNHKDFHIEKVEGTAPIAE
jgi:ammonia channel protein AmtB